MIRNRLAVLLAERGLKITRVAKDTGISRNTITATAQNDSEMIRLETINVLCQYLSIKPGDFFEYEPFDIDFTLFIGPYNTRINKKEDKISFTNVDFDLFMDIKGSPVVKTIELRCSLEPEQQLSIIQSTPQKLTFNISFNNNDEKVMFVESIYNQISPTFHKNIYNNLVSSIETKFKQSLGEVINKLIQEKLDLFDFDVFLEQKIKNITENMEIEIESDVFKQF